MRQVGQPRHHSIKGGGVFLEMFDPLVVTEVLNDILSRHGLEFWAEPKKNLSHPKKMARNPHKKSAGCATIRRRGTSLWRRVRFGKVRHGMAGEVW